MRALLSEKLEDTFAETRLKVQGLTQDLKRLEALMKNTKDLDLLWPYRLNIKNAVKSVEFAAILNVFRRKAANSASMAEIELTTKELWHKLQVQKAGGIGAPSDKFRGYLNGMKDELLYYDNINRKWRLTEKSIELLK